MSTIFSKTEKILETGWRAGCNTPIIKDKVVPKAQLSRVIEPSERIITKPIKKKKKKGVSSSKKKAKQVAKSAWRKLKLYVKCWKVPYMFYTREYRKIT